MTDVFKETKAQETAKRAIEIALAGGHSIRFLPYDKDDRFDFTQYDLDRLKPEQRAAMDAYMARFNGKPTGIEAAAAQCAELDRAAAYLADRCGIAAPITGTDLSISIAATSMIDILLPCPAEASEPIMARIATARARRDSIGPMDPNAEALLANWRAHFVNVSDAAVSAVLEVARTIAALHDRGDWITRIALAEALSYFRETDDEATARVAPKFPDHSEITADQFIAGTACGYSDFNGSAVVARYRTGGAPHVEIRTPGGRHLMSPIMGELGARNFFEGLGRVLAA